ncbi:MAG: guanylate kinase [Clostridia bacterium]|jgi:guanylate kinase|nr:guanylate kinase [Clostridia bacterium]MCX4367730.1 guanylate kinase [Clostridia bacterium]
MNKGLLIIVSGPSGAGKGTVLKEVFDEIESLRYSVSVTTRKPREGEKEGESYFFKSLEEFEDMIERDEFLEYQPVFGNYYGTPKEYVERLRTAGYDVVLEIDVKGAMSVKERVSDAVLIFLTPESKEILRSRLINRKTESAAELEKRVGESIRELETVEKYEYVVVNDTIERCADDIIAIINAEKRKVGRNAEFINRLLERR